MKTIRKTLMIALCGVLMSGAVSASGMATASQTEVGQTEEEARKKTFQVGMYRIIHSLTMNVLVEKKLGERVTVKLLDTKGNVLFTDYMSRRQQKYGRKFDFSQVPDGNYSVVISNGQEQITKDIKLSTYNLYEMPARTLMAVN